jgi:hypothetical protein
VDETAPSASFDAYCWHATFCIMCDKMCSVDEVVRQFVYGLSGKRFSAEAFAKVFLHLRLFFQTRMSPVHSAGL